MPLYITSYNIDHLQSNMPGMDLVDPAWASEVQHRNSLKSSKKASRVRDNLHSSSLRARYSGPTALDSPALVTHIETTTTPESELSDLVELPPTPPEIHHDLVESGLDDSSNAETTILRSGVVTPNIQKSPPTPDRTPPRAQQYRPLITNQPSFVSTRAESFKTAQEELSSDEESSIVAPGPTPWAQRIRTPPQTLQVKSQDRQASPLAQTTNSSNHPESSTIARVRMKEALPAEGTFDLVDFLRKRSPAPVSNADSKVLVDDSAETKLTLDLGPIQASTSEKAAHADVLTVPETPKASENGKGLAFEKPVGVVNQATTSPLIATPPQQTIISLSELQHTGSIRRNQSLRERLESRRVVSSPSTERFGQDIGWSRLEQTPSLRDKIESWRLSGISTTSTVEAMVVDTPPQRSQTLRHRLKHTSLRSVSSPLEDSKRVSLISHPDSVHRLTHKKGTLSNKDRWSMNSAVSRSLSTASSQAIPSRPEVIHVAVIPARRSSLNSTATSGKRHSSSASLGSGGSRAHGINHSRGSSMETPSRKRTLSESLPTGASFADRGRHSQHPPSVPLRSSSLSAPTSRSNSRANSLTSDGQRMRKLAAAEADVHKTLARMESERSAKADNISTSSPPRAPIEQKRTLRRSTDSGVESLRRAVELDNSHIAPIRPSLEPATDSWGSMRPPSTHATPFSQPSVQSGSPGPIETGQARAVNFFPHNNHSLQLIEKYPTAESQAVQRLHTTENDLQLIVDDPATPRPTSGGFWAMNSPLRNPRAPPQPPKLYIIPPTPAGRTPANEDDRQLAEETSTKRTRSLGRRFGSLKRPSLADRQRTGSFLKSLTRSLSLKDATNRKANQDLDGKLHPFWRPRGFWDEFSESETDDSIPDEDIVVNNSLGMPQTRIIFDGPLSLVRRISDGQRQRKNQRSAIGKRASTTSLSKVRAARKVYKLPIFAKNFRILGLRDMHERMMITKQRKEDEKRERRREDLRRSIGANVISHGDSRYPREGATLTWGKQSQPSLDEQVEQYDWQRPESSIHTGDAWMMGWFPSSSPTNNHSRKNNNAQ